MSEFCTKCGNPIKQGSQYCGICGARIYHNKNDVIYAQKKGSKFGRRICIIAAIVCCMVMISGCIMVCFNLSLQKTQYMKGDFEKGNILKRLTSIQVDVDWKVKQESDHHEQVDDTLENENDKKEKEYNNEEVALGNEPVRVADAYYSCEYGDFYLYTNSRLEYWQIYPVQFTETILIPDNGDGIELSTQDGECSLIMSGAYDVLLKPIEELYAEAQNGRVLDSVCTVNYFWIEQENNAGSIEYIANYKIEGGNILSFKMTYPVSKESYYKYLGHEMTTAMVEMNGW